MSLSTKTLHIEETFFQSEQTLQITGTTKVTPTILEALLANNIGINHSCGGQGTCGTCRVEILSGMEHLNIKNETEAEFFNEYKLSPNIRLSCQTYLAGEVKIKICNKPI